jgi:hypothetical protein
VARVNRFSGERVALPTPRLVASERNDAASLTSARRDSIKLEKLPA